MLRLINVAIDHGRLGDDVRSRYTERHDPLFSWGAVSSNNDAYQTACRLVVDGLWDSGWVDTRKQQLRYAGDTLPEGSRIEFTLMIRDNSGESAEHRSSFYFAGIDWKAKWIGIPEDRNEIVRYFSRSFNVDKSIVGACLYACGIGYSSFLINGVLVSPDTHLEPAYTEWKKTCQYVMYPELEGFIRTGSNELGAILAAGWRHSPKSRPKADPAALPDDFSGGKMLTAMLRLTYEDGTSEWICTDDEWLTGEGPYVSASLFDGVVYDASREVKYTGNAEILDGPGGTMCPMLIPPVREFKKRAPIAVWSVNGGLVVDFGQNMAGVIRIVLPDYMKFGQKIILRHAEEIDDSGELDTTSLRDALAVDTYIAAGNGDDIGEWQPEYTYHGFRYAKIEGIDETFDAVNRVLAVELHTDLELRSHFRCGNTLVSKLHEMCMETERGNMHSILTDCPQRSERMGWMNDATVRFEEISYNFDIGRIFPKIIRDIIDEQGDDGAITCTAPFGRGSRPADPVCSAFLVAAREALMHTGNTDIVRETYDRFVAWQQCLLEHSTDYIVDYSYYGDWAGPAFACEYINETRPGSRSDVTPGVFMSTGYSYLNCLMLSRFAGTLGYAEDERRYERLAAEIKAAMVDKWYNSETGVMATGSQACQAFALYLDLIAGDDARKAAEHLHNELVEGGYKLTTGNLCSRYILDALAKHGYVDDAWRLLTREEYPSVGFMIQNEATTFWERYDPIRNMAMNSHNHPMYGACDYFMYAYIAGIKPVSPGWNRFKIEPYMPENLYSAQAIVDTVMGEINVRWMRRYGKCVLHVMVPFGATATVHFCGKRYEVGSGFHTYSVEE